MVFAVDDATGNSVNQAAGAPSVDIFGSLAMDAMGGSTSLKPKFEAIDVDGVWLLGSLWLETKAGVGFEVDVGEDGTELPSDAKVFLSQRGHFGQYSLVDKPGLSW